MSARAPTCDQMAIGCRSEFGIEDLRPDHAPSLGAVNTGRVATDCGCVSPTPTMNEAPYGWLQFDAPCCAEPPP